MSQINGKYLYNLQSGETIGVRKSKVTEDDGLTGDEQIKKVWDSNGGYEAFYLLGENTTNDIQCGTVEDLNFTQIVELFLQGNMVVEDLRVGLESKGAKNIVIQKSGQTTVVTFEYNGKNYTLNCASDAAASQIDDITVSDISDKMSVTGGCRVYENYDNSQLHPEWREGDHSCENSSVWFWNDDCFGRVSCMEEFEWDNGLIRMNYDRYFNIESMLFKAIPLYFGHESCNPNDLTDEEIQYVNDHPEIFHAVLNKRKDGAVEVAVDYQMLVATSDIMSADESYYWAVEDFKNKLYGGSKHNLLGAGLTNAIYAPSVDGNNVVFDDDAIQRIYARLQEIKNQGYNIYSTSGYVQGNIEFQFLRNLNIQMDDSVDTVREKIAAFCNGLGSSDGKTIHIEDYYAAVPGNYSYEDFVKEAAQWPSVLQSRCNDYNKVFGSITNSFLGDITQISRDFANNCQWNVDMLKNFLIQENGGLFYFEGGAGRRAGAADQTTGGDTVGGSTGDVPDVDPVKATYVPSADYTQEELDAIKQEQYNILIDEIKNSTVYSDYATRYKDLPFYYINCFAYLYTQVGLDANNNVLLDDNFKEQLKKFFQACSEYSVKYGSSIYDTYYDSTFGPTLKLLGIAEGSLKSEDFAKLANDPAGLDQVIANMRAVIGVSDGEPITIDKYYAALAKCGVGHESNPQLYKVEKATYSTFYTEEAFIEAARLQHFLEDYKNSPSYDPYFVSEFTHPYANGGNTLLQGSDMISPPGTLRTDEIIDLILNDPIGPSRNDLLGMIELAAGISVDDEPSVKREKLKALFKSLNYTPLTKENDDFVKGYVNGVDLYRYLLGNNPGNIDYFATHSAMLNAIGNARQEKEDWLKSNPAVDYDYDSSIPIDDYSDSYVDKIKFKQGYFETQADADKAEEIYNYIADLVAPLYNKWYEKLGADGYKYFTEDNSGWYDVDSDSYAKRGLAWKNASDRENCYNEFAAVAQQIMEKYGDLFSSFVFDGEKFVYTLKNGDGVFTPTVENAGNMYHPFDNGYFEASCDNPVSFLPVTTYTTNPPEALPVDEDGGTIVKTDYEGILVSTTGNIYLWDEIEQKYWKLDGSNMGYPNPYQVASEILSGNCEKLLCHTPNLGLDTSIMNYIDLLAFSLINGYNRTSSPNIFEKDGVYYTFDESRLRHFGSDSVKLVVMETPTAPAPPAPAAAPAHADSASGIGSGLGQSTYVGSTVQMTQFGENTPSEAKEGATFDEVTQETPLADEPEDTPPTTPAPALEPEEIPEDPSTDPADDVNTVTAPALNPPADPAYYNRYQQYIQKGAQAFVLTYFNFDPPTFNRFSELTDEQVEFVNAHPEIFHLTIDINSRFRDVLSYDEYITDEPIGQGKVYKYEAGTYDMFGNGNPTGPDGSIPVGIDGVFVKPENRNGENGFYIYLYDSSKGEYVKTWHHYDGTMGSAIMALKHGQIQWADPMMFDNDAIPGLYILITLQAYGNKERDLYCSLLFGYNQTDKEGIFEKDGKYYRVNQNAKDFLARIDESKTFIEVSKDEIEGDITVYTSKPPKIEEKKSIEGLNPISMPSNISYDDFMAMIVMQNFLTSDDTKPFEIQHFDNGPYIYVDKWTRLNGQEITPENYKQYLNTINYYDKDELAALVLEKLLEKSGSIYGQAYNTNEPLPWVTELIKAIGGTDFSFKAGSIRSTNTTRSFIEYSYASFTVNGTKYTIPIAPDIGSEFPPEEEILTKEQVEELRQYMSPEAFNELLNWYFVSLNKVNGETEKYMFVYDGNMNYYLQNNGREARKAPGYMTGNTFTRRADGTGGFQGFLEYVKTHDVDAIRENAYSVNIVEADQYNQLKQLGLNDEVLSWYLQEASSDYLEGDYEHRHISSYIFTYNRDLNVPYPKLYTFEDLYNYAKTHDLNAEFAALKSGAGNSSGGANAPSIEISDDFGGDDDETPPSQAGCRVYENYDGPIRGQGAGERIALANVINNAMEGYYGLLNIEQTIGISGLRIVDDYNIAEEFVCKYFGISKIDDLSDEQIKFVNNNPQIFHLVNFSKGGWAYDASFEQFIIDTFINTEYWLSPEELYCGRIENLKSQIESRNTAGHFGVINQMKLDGNNVSWDESTVEYILNYLKSPAPFGDNEKKQELMNLFGFTVNDDATAIRQKLEKFFRLNGSSDGKTIHIEDYYNATTVALNKFGSYEDLVEFQSKYLNQVRQAASAEAAQYGNNSGADLIAYIMATTYSNIKGLSNVGNPDTVLENAHAAGSFGSNRSGSTGTGSNGSLNSENSYVVNDGEYGSEIILTPDNRGVDYDSIPRVPATVIPADDYVRQPGESDEEYAINRWNRIVENMKNAYPDAGYDLEYYLEQMGDLAKYEYMGPTSFTLDAMTLDNNFYNVGSGDWLAVLSLAAGINPSDSNKTKEAKLIALFKQVGSVGKDVTGRYTEVSCDMVKMLQYLAGNNSEKVNYFATMQNISAAEIAMQEQMAEYMQNYSSDDADPSIEVEEASATSGANGPRTDLEKEINQYMGEMLRELYAKYYAYDKSIPGYYYFEKNPLADTSGNIDSSKNETEMWTWKNEEDRAAFWSAIQDIINKVMEKYGDSVSGIYFNGDEPTIILKNGKEISGMLSGSYDAYVPGELRSKGYQQVVPFGNKCQDVTDHPVLVADNIEVYENNIPEKAPVDKNGDAMIPTQWAGIYVSKDGKVYVWDSVNNKYKGLSSNINGLDLLSGKTDSLFGGYLYTPTPEECDLLIPLLYGLKGTNYSEVYADENGKFYKLSNTGTGKLSLVEIDVIELNSSNPGANAPAVNPSDDLQDEQSDPEDETPSADEPKEEVPTTPAPQQRPRIIPGSRPIDITVLKDLNGRIRPFEPVDPTVKVTDDVKIVPTEDDETVDEIPETTEEPKELMASEDYKHEAKNNVEELQKKVGNVINNNGLYYNVFNGKTYCYVWDPYEHKWLTFDPNDMTNGKANDSANKTLMRIQRILAVLKQGLIFTTNPNICKDKDGNYYDYDEKLGTFEKRR